jgi:hypothetical protein
LIFYTGNKSFSKPEKEEYMNGLLRLVSLQLLVKCAREWEPGQPAPDCARWYWDLAYWYKFGVPKIPNKELPQIFWPPRPLPDPPPFWNLGMELLLPELMDMLLDDPNPEPSIFLTQIWGDTQTRIASAKRTIELFEKAIPQLHQEIARLEQLQ